MRAGIPPNGDNDKTADAETETSALAKVTCRDCMDSSLRTMIREGFHPTAAKAHIALAIKMGGFTKCSHA